LNLLPQNPDNNSLTTSVSTNFMSYRSKLLAAKYL